MATEVKSGNYLVAETAGGPKSVIGSPARLVTLVVTTAPTTACTFWDNASGAGSGTVLFSIPANAAAGTIYSLDIPAVNGISCTIGTAGVVNVVYSLHN